MWIEAIVEPADKLRAEGLTVPIVSHPRIERGTTSQPFGVFKPIRIIVNRDLVLLRLPQSRDPLRPEAWGRTGTFAASCSLASVPFRRH